MSGLSLWLQLCGSLVLTQHALWPQLDELTVVRAMRVNSSTYSSSYHLYPIRRTFRDKHVYHRDVSSLRALQQAVQGEPSECCQQRLAHAEAQRSFHHLPLPRLRHLQLYRGPLDSLPEEQLLQPADVEQHAWLPILPLLRALRHLCTVELNLPLQDYARLFAQLKTGDLPVSLSSLHLCGFRSWSGGSQECLARLPAHALPASLHVLRVDSLVRVRDCGLPDSLHELVVECSWPTAEHPAALVPWPHSLAVLGMCVDTSYSLTLPHSLHALTLSFVRGSPLLSGWLPAQLRSLTLYGLEAAWLPDALPHTLEQLHLHDCALHLHPLQRGSLPPALLSLTVERRLPGPTSYEPLVPLLGPLVVDALPASLTSLTLDGHAPHSFVPGALPTGLTQLNMRCCDFNQPCLPGWLPRRLRSLTLGEFNHPLDAGLLPHSIEELCLHACSQPIRVGSLPSKLRHLVLDSHFVEWELEGIATERKAEDGLIEVGALPDGLTSLELRRPMTMLVPGQLPASLRLLELGTHFFAALPPRWLPAGLTHLVFSGAKQCQPSATNAQGEEVLPASLRSLVFGKSPHCFPALRTGDLPQGVTRLDISVRHEWSCPSPLPASLTSLSLISRQPLCAGVLHDGLVDLALRYYSHALVPGLWPPSLRRLQIGRHSVNWALSEGVLPASLSLLELSCKYKEVHGEQQEQPPWLPWNTELRWLDDYMD